MYLKSIEIQGFKSFANKIVLEFHNGITGIVGPNGSGKSNVADAVRWVLGEQRVRQLRGASMQDVIFAGTESRKPQGFASVAITLDNSDHQLAIDYDQVTVSRRLYRSGESEYRINGNACRLKDIQELFYDTGIGKEGYSIIGQGQIERILSGRPEERRELFDEAAGIVKFKRRKAIAQKKLEDEKQNLVRVADILAELEKQVGPLARQAETAREYLRLKEELKGCEVSRFVREMGELEEQLQQTAGRESMVSGDLEDVRRESDQVKATYEALDEELSGLNRQIEECRNRKNACDMEKGGMAGQVSVLLEQINTEKANARHYETRIQAIAQETEEKSRQLQEYQDRYQELALQADQEKQQQETAEEHLRQRDEAIMLLDQQIETGKGNMILALNERADLTARQQRYGAMLEQVQVRRAEVSQRLLRIKSDESVQEEQKQAEEGRLEESTRLVEELSLRQTEWEDQIRQMEDTIRRLNRNLNEKQQEYRSDSVRLESLRNLAERYDGYGGSIRRVMETRDRIGGIHGVVADIITTKKEYETAIETALGGSIQHIVTDSETTAKQLIQYLKKNRYGRCTFLPLTSVGQRGEFEKRQALSEPGVIGLASSLVEAAREYAGLVGYLLGRVVVTDNMDHAIALARKYRYSFRIVTLDGELLSTGGSITGGAFKNSSNLLGRKREIEELEERCSRSMTQAEKLEADVQMAEAQLKEKREELEALQGQRQQAVLQQNTFRMNVAQLEEKIQDIQDSAKDLELENRQLEEQIREIGQNQKELSEGVEDMDSRRQQADLDIQELTRQLETARETREELFKNLSEIQLRAAALRQQYQFARENRERVQEEIRRLEEEKQQLEEKTGGTDAAIAQRQQEISRLEEQIADMDRQKQALEEEESQMAGQREQTAGRQKGLFARREELSERMTALDRDLFRLQNQREKLSDRMEQHTEYMWNEYQLTLSAAKELPEPEASGDLKKHIDQLKAAIRALGNVNVNAIEDYKEISQRHGFMKSQYEDLTRAEAALVKIIEELDTGMRRQFAEKFQEIQKEFDKVFRELFGGGHGTLELTEGEDILEAGIRIIAQPPGKKLQNMMQLSGGEKALTAISLLFAIQNLKPSPFCLLDEIEAALDDSNVDRFARYLHKLIRYTQFIVITHRRGTMVAADRLYGITMQEKGVSALVSVSLIEDSLEH